MKQLFTISGRYAATEEVSITPQVGYDNKIKDIIIISTRLYIYSNTCLSLRICFFLCFDCMCDVVY